MKSPSPPAPFKTRFPRYIDIGHSDEIKEPLDLSIEGLFARRGLKTACI